MASCIRHADRHAGEVSKEKRRIREPEKGPKNIPAAVEILRGLSGVEVRTFQNVAICKIFSSRFGLATGAFFIRSSPSTYKSREIVKEMVGDIRSTFEIKLKNLKWMDRKVRESALGKLAAMKEFLIYPDEILDDGLLETYYKNINFEVIACVCL